MNEATMKSGCVAIAVLAYGLLAGSSLAAPPPTTTFDLTGVGTGNVLAGVYTSPYSGSVTGPSGPTISVICDDFADDSYVPEQWTAYVTPLSTLTSSTDSYLKWNKSQYYSSLTQTQAYTVASVLAVDILQSTGTAQEDYSFALWDLFDANAFAQLTAYGLSTSVEQTDLTNAYNFVTSGANTAQVQADVAATTIYSYVPGSGTSCPSGNCPPPPQEFITVNMAEPPFLAEFAVYLLLGGGGLLFWCRKRIRRVHS
jgi:hypothetical protein